MPGIKVSESAIKFIKNYSTICVAGQIKNEDAPKEHFRMWYGAIIHGVTHKLILYTPPVFKKKMDAILFMEDLKVKCQREIFKVNQIVEIN